MLRGVRILKMLRLSMSKKRLRMFEKVRLAERKKGQLNLKKKSQFLAVARRGGSGSYKHETALVEKTSSWRAGAGNNSGAP